MTVYWRKSVERWDLVLIGEPDCHAYIIRYWSAAWKTSAWCWTLTMPRGGHETARSRPNRNDDPVTVKIRWVRTP